MMAPAPVFLLAAALTVTPTDLTQRVAETASAVVHIRAEQPTQVSLDDPLAAQAHRVFEQEPGVAALWAPTEQTGSGFVWMAAPQADGVIVMTNAHVVGRSDYLTVTFDDGRSGIGRPLGVDAASDVAVLHVALSAPWPTPVVKGDPQFLKPGEAVFAVGSPLGFDKTVTTGVVSALQRSGTDPVHPLTPFIQTDAAINPGSSGGPLFNLRGEVVGMNTQILTPTGGFIGIGLAVPIDYAGVVAHRLLTEGSFERGWIGVVGQTLTPALRAAFPNVPANAVIVSALAPNSPAAGSLQPGDAVVALDGKRVTGPTDLARRVAEKRTGQSLDLDVVQPDGERRIRLRAAATPAEPHASSSPTPNIAAALSVTQIEPEQTKELGITGTAVVVTRLSPEARRAGLAVGDVVLAVDGRPTPTQQAFEAAWARATHTVAQVYVLRHGRKAFAAVPRG